VEPDLEGGDQVGLFDQTVLKRQHSVEQVSLGIDPGHQVSSRSGTNKPLLQKRISCIFSRLDKP